MGLFPNSGVIPTLGRVAEKKKNNASKLPLWTHPGAGIFRRSCDIEQKEVVLDRGNSG